MALSATEFGPALWLGAVGLPLLLGASLLRCLGVTPRTDRLAYPGWAWLCGALGTGALELVLLLLGTPGRWSLAAATLVAVGLLRWRSGGVRPLEPAPGPPGGWAERRFFQGVVLLVLLIACQRVLLSSMSVLVDDDEANFWALRAKLLFGAGGFEGAYQGAIAARELPNSSYPLLNSLLQLTVFQWAGGVTHYASRLPIQLCAVALLLCAAAAFRRAARPGIAALLVLLLLSAAPLQVAFRNANSDVLVALGALVSADALRRGSAQPSRAWLGLGALAAAFLVWSKKEGGVLLLLGLAAWLAFALGREGRAGLARLRVLWPWLLVPLAFQSVTWIHNLALDATGSHTVDLAQVRRALGALGTEGPQTLQALGALALKDAMHAVPAAFFVLALLGMRLRPHAALDFVPLACLAFLAVVTGVYLTNNAGYLLRTTSARVFLQLLPLQMLWIADTLTRLLAPAGAGRGQSVA